MRIDNIKEQNFKRANQQCSIAKSKYSTPVFKQTDYELHFKSLNAISNSNRLIVNNKKELSFKGGTELISFTESPLVKALGHYASMDSVKELYRKTAPELVKKIEELEPIANNKAEIRGLYHDFASRNLFSLGEHETPKKYTSYWAKNKKLGDKNLVDFWLSSLGMDIKGKTPLEKTKILNGLSTKQKHQLIDNTVKHWISEVLPVDLAKANRNDIQLLQTGTQQQLVKPNIEEIRNDLISSVNDTGIAQFESEEIQGKSLIDFWIEIIDGENSTKGFSVGLKKRRLVEIINSDEDLNKIYSRTIEEAAKGSEQIKRTQEAIKNLIEDSALDTPAQALLETYQNSQLFFQIVNQGNKNKNSIAGLEISAKRILDDLAEAKRAIIQHARVYLFEPLKDVGLMTRKDDLLLKTNNKLLVTIIADKKLQHSPEENKELNEAIGKILLVNDNYSSRVQESLLAVKQSISKITVWDGRDLKNKYSLLQVFRRFDIEQGLSKIEKLLVDADNNNYKCLFDAWGNLKEIISNSLDPKSLPNEIKAFDTILTEVYERRSMYHGIVVQALQGIVDIAQEHFESIQINRALDDIIKKRINVQEVLNQNPAIKIQQALESPHLDYEQKEFIARYKDDENISNLLKLPNIRIQEDVNSLLSIEQTNETVFDLISSTFRNNLSAETVSQLSEFADAYLKVLGFDFTKYNLQEKYELLSKVPLEELEMASVDVKSEWSKKYLSKAISDTALEKLRSLDVNINTAKMVDQLGKINLKLDNVIVQLQEQNYTLRQIATSIDHFISIYKQVSSAIYTRLGDMALSLESIHVDTSNIRTNIRAMLFQSIQSTKDPVLRNEMQSLLQDVDRMQLSEFIRTVEAKRQKYRDDHKMDVFCGFLMEKVVKPTLLAGSIVGISTFAPHAAPFLMAHGLSTISHSITSGTLQRALYTSVQCSGARVGFLATEFSGGRFGTQMPPDML